MRPVRSSTVTIAIGLPGARGESLDLAHQRAQPHLGAFLEHHDVRHCVRGRPARSLRPAARAGARRNRTRAPPSRAALRSRSVQAGTAESAAPPTATRLDARVLAEQRRLPALRARAGARRPDRAHGPTAANSRPRSLDPARRTRRAATRHSSTRRFMARPSSRRARSKRSRTDRAGARHDQRLDRRLPHVAHGAEPVADARRLRA